MGKPTHVSEYVTLDVTSVPREVKHFSTWWKRNKQYFLSSGERKGMSPNSTFIVSCMKMFDAIKVGGSKVGTCYL